MRSFTYTVTDPLGLHARPAGLLAKQIQTYPCKVTLSAGGKTADGRRVLALMKMAVKTGQEVTFVLEGEGEEEAAAKLEAFCKENI